MAAVAVVVVMAAVDVVVEMVATVIVVGDGCNSCNGDAAIAIVKITAV